MIRSSTARSSRRRLLLLVALLAGIATTAIGVHALVGPDDGLAKSRLAEAARERPLTDAGALVANTTDQALNDGIDDANDHALLGAAELQLARETADPAHYARAEEAFGRSLEIDPDNLEALIGTGILALARHDFAAALAIGEAAVVAHPSVPRLYGLIGDAQVELGRYDEALITIQRMVDLRPDLASYSRVSYLRELHGDLPGAIEAMQLAVEAGGSATENTEYVRVQLGHLLFAIGDLAAAESAFRASLERFPGYVHAVAGLARVRAAQGDLPAAIDLYRQAAERTPLPEFVVALGEAYEADGRMAEARDQYELVEAIHALQQANGIATDVELAAFFADHGDPQRALALARGAYERAPSIRAADALAWALHASGSIGEAARLADEALATGSADARILFHAGVIAAAAGQPEAARARLSRALELNPRFSPLGAPMAAEALARLPEGD